ncbi:murein biosynthesis integral membrane protein MurJ [Kitasatospora camelliae]|uniref:Murein biosynthesis integral membrane protein MurJ n=1 Tax=Kitasatospora camelliae TaxID=3156397 RepID=A0AAU8JXF0_9ACTN
MTDHSRDESSAARAYPDSPTMPLRRIPAQGPAGYDEPAGPAATAPAAHPAAAPTLPVPPAPAAASQAPQAGTAQAEAPETEEKPRGSVARNGLIMALGSLASRALGFVRSAMIVAALTTGPLGDAFNVGNSLPNIVYMMLIGGALASVFVPELVHAAQTHKDGGVAYTDRLLTLCGVVLVVLTVGAWLAAPVIVDFYSEFHGAQRDLTIAFARYCLPQIFFYGVFTLLGQVLNSRDRFGAMMWTPVLNNVVAIGVFGLYMVIGDQARTADQMTSGQAMLLGLGSTLGIVVQAVGLLPSLRGSGFRYRPRFDWKGAGLTRPLRSAGWALMLVVVTQLAFAVITKLTTAAGQAGQEAGLPMGLGNLAYSNAYQLFMVPQGIITISMVTAILPALSRNAASGEYTAIGADIAGVLRASAAMIVPATVILFALAPQICTLAYGYGHSTQADTLVIAQVLMAMVVGLPAFCAQYAVARGFYALNDARTPFWMTVITVAVNAVVSVVAYQLLEPRWIIVGMGVAQSAAALASIVTTGWALGRRLKRGPRPTPEAAAPDATLVLGTGPLKRPSSGLEGGRVTLLHVMIALACLPGALGAHWLAGRFGTDLLGSLGGLAAGSVAILVSLFVLARPLGAASAVAPLARRLRIPYPDPAAAAGRHRR